MPKISELPELTNPADNDEIAVRDDSASTTKKLSFSNLITKLQSSLNAGNWLGNEAKQIVTKRCVLMTHAQVGGGVSESYQEAYEVAFTAGTITNYARAKGIIPADYAGGDISIYFRAWSSSTNTSKVVRSYCGLRSTGDAYSAWNIFSSNTQNVSITANIQHEFLIDQVIPEANIAINDFVAIAIRFDSGITGTVYITSIELEYNAYE